MWHGFILPQPRVYKVERKPLPPKTVDALVEAGEKVQDSFDAHPELKELYSEGHNRLLKIIAENVKKVENNA